MLLSLTGAVTSRDEEPLSGGSQLDALLARCTSEVQLRFLHFLVAGDYRLPDAVLPTMAGGPQPDFLYGEATTALFLVVDGSEPEEDNSRFCRMRGMMSPCSGERSTGPRRSPRGRGSSGDSSTLLTREYAGPPAT
ncbi:MAG: hypothetical protein U0841_21900 [Chloroflexia bacterium]